MDKFTDIIARVLVGVIGIALMAPGIAFVISICAWAITGSWPLPVSGDAGAQLLRTMVALMLFVPGGALLLSAID